jgi:hypothetical protein
MVDSPLNCMTGTEFSVAFEGFGLVYVQVYLWCIASISVLMK